jgi:TusA-related sulfurtransferase
MRDYKKRGANQKTSGEKNANIRYGFKVRKQMDKKGLISSISLLVLLTTTSCGFFISRYIRQNRERKLGGGGTSEAFAPNYDLKSVITVSGSVVKAEKFVAKPMQVESVRIFLKSEHQTYEAHLGPVWYIKKQAYQLVPGDKITVTGSQIGDKIMIEKFEKDGQVFVLRSEQGQPKWFKSVVKEAGGPAHPDALK